MRRASLWESSGSSRPTASTMSQCTPLTRMETSRSWRWRTSKSDSVSYICCYRGADKSLARPGREQTRKQVRDARDFNKIETRAVIKFLFLQGKAPKEIHAILTETLACFLPGRAKDIRTPGTCYEGLCPNSDLLGVGRLGEFEPPWGQEILSGSVQPRV